MRINPFDLKKADLQTYLTGYCSHRMPYQQHPNCFKMEILQGFKKEKIGYLDIETSHLKANMGIIFTYYIKTHNKNKYYSGKIKVSDLRNETKDKKIVEKLINDMKKFDVIVTYYGSRFDIPFIRTRAVKWGLDFPLYKHIIHKDVYYIIKHRFCFSRNTLENACKLFKIDGKNHLDFEVWLKAVTGDKKSLDYIYLHNKHDVDILNRLYNKVMVYVRNDKKSI